MSTKICFIGAGNLATHLSKALQEKGYKITQVYSRTESSAKSLAQKLNVVYTTSTTKIKNADIYFVALKDAVVDDVLKEIDFKKNLVVHCSGSLPISVLEKHALNIGVFYPLQTFSKDRNVDFDSIPIFVESNSDVTEKRLVQMASDISESVTVLNSEKRKFLHISAVFACNFVNHLYTISSKLLESQGISFDVLKPIILETACKVQEMNPAKAQTGPAVRFDENIIKAHLQELKDFNNYQELYKSISRSIFDHNKQQ